MSRTYLLRFPVSCVLVDQVHIHSDKAEATHSERKTALRRVKVAYWCGKADDQKLYHVCVLIFCRYLLSPKDLIGSSHTFSFVAHSLIGEEFPVIFAIYLFIIIMLISLLYFYVIAIPFMNTKIGILFLLSKIAINGFWINTYILIHFRDHKRQSLMSQEDIKFNLNIL